MKTLAWPIPEQANPNKVQDTLKMLADPSFLAVYAVMDKETQKMIMQMLLMGSMGGSKDGASMLSFIIMMQQSQPKPVEQPRNEGVALVTALTEGIKLGKDNNTNQNNPIQMFEAMTKVMQPLQQNQSDMAVKLLEAKMDALKESSQPMTFDKTIDMIKTTNEIFGEHQSATEQDVRIAALTAETRLKEYQLNLDARKVAEEAKTENMKWQQIGGLLTSVGGAVAPTLITAATQGMQSHQPEQREQQAQQVQQQQPSPAPTYQPVQQVQAQPENATGVKYMTMRYRGCEGTFEIHSDENGVFKKFAKCPHCREILEVDMGSEGEENDGEEGVPPGE